jgi:hypothetical protein
MYIHDIWFLFTVVGGVCGVDAHCSVVYFQKLSPVPVLARLLDLSRALELTMSFESS